MELKVFVKETLIQITEGIEEAQRHFKQSGSSAKVNPYMTIIDKSPGRLVTGGKRSNVEVVEFDVAIIVNEGSETSAGGGLTVASIFKAGAEGRSTQLSGTESRIKLKVPISFPMDKQQHNSSK